MSFSLVSHAHIPADGRGWVLIAMVSVLMVHEAYVLRCPNGNRVISNCLMLPTAAQGKNAYGVSDPGQSNRWWLP